jgi:hypothetical protein
VCVSWLGEENANHLLKLLASADIIMHQSSEGKLARAAWINKLIKRIQKSLPVTELA